MRLSIELPNGYPRRFVWWMECDVCRVTRSAPAWQQQDLPLSKFEALGWMCEKTRDTCPDCLAIMRPTEQATPDSSSTERQS